MSTAVVANHPEAVPSASEGIPATALHPAPQGEAEGLLPPPGAAGVRSGTVVTGGSTASDPAAMVGAAEAASAAAAAATADGMRREWNFTLTFRHQAARCLLQYIPQWRCAFIDPDEVDKLDSNIVKHTLLLPFFKYVDLSAQRHAGEMWEEIPKTVQLFYSHLTPDTTLESYCKTAVKRVLRRNRGIYSIDGQTNLRNLIIGQKLHTLYKLGGLPSFVFRYHIHDNSALLDTHAFVIGTISDRRGYLLVTECSHLQELDGYVRSNLLPHYTDPNRMSLDQDVTYSVQDKNVYTVLREQQERFGDLHYLDRDALVSFALPMHPMNLRPDYSPTQTVDVGSIACMTLELDVHQKLIDDLGDGVESLAAGIDKYKTNHVVLFLDVEDVAKMGYPGVMSIEQFSGIKMKRLMEIFKDSKMVGSPLSLPLGRRTGRSRTFTFTYEPWGTVVKAMTVSTLVGNSGITAMYFTKLGGGMFDSHLYLFQQMLHSIAFQSERETRGTFTRPQAVNIRITEQDVGRAYTGAPAGAQTFLEQHLRALQMSNEGRAKGATVMPVDPALGGLPHATGDGKGTVASAALTSAAGGKTRSSTSGKNQPPAALPRLSEVDPTEAEQAAAAVAAMAATTAAAVATADEDAEAKRDEDMEEGESCSSVSPDNASVISVGSIAYLWETTELVSAEVVADDDNGSCQALPNSGNLSATSPAEVAPCRNSTSSVTDGALQGPVAAMATPGREATVVEGLSRASVASAGTSTAGGNDMTDSVAEGGLTPKSSAELGTSPLLPAASAPEANEAVLAPEKVQANIDQALKGDETDTYLFPSLRVTYTRCCDAQMCRPNSYLVQKLPDHPRFASSVEEIDLTANYLGKNGFIAVLHLLDHMPRLRSVIFNEMSLDNEDVENLCNTLATNSTVSEVYLCGNNRITLPATKHLTHLLRSNPRIKVLELEGTKLGEGLVRKLAEQAAANANKVCNQTTQ